MKTIFFKFSFIVLLIILITYNLILTQNEIKALSNVSLNNIEALASNEKEKCPSGCATGGSGCYCNGWYSYCKEINW